MIDIIHHPIGPDATRNKSICLSVASFDTVSLPIAITITNQTRMKIVTNTNIANEDNKSINLNYSVEFHPLKDFLVSNLPLSSVTLW